MRLQITGMAARMALALSFAASVIPCVTPAWGQQVSTGTGTTYSVWVSNTGNVGIGTQNPTTALDVSGSVSVSGTLKLASDGSEPCDSDHLNALRFNPSTHSLQICQP